MGRTFQLVEIVRRTGSGSISLISLAGYGCQKEREKEGFGCIKVV
jgi:hypothetical protein